MIERTLEAHDKSGGQNSGWYLANKLLSIKYLKKKPNISHIRILQTIGKKLTISIFCAFFLALFFY